MQENERQPNDPTQHQLWRHMSQKRGKLTLQPQLAQNVLSAHTARVAFGHAPLGRSGLHTPRACKLAGTSPWLVAVEGLVPWPPLDMPLLDPVSQIKQGARFKDPLPNTRAPLVQNYPNSKTQTGQELQPTGVEYPPPAGVKRFPAPAMSRPRIP
jgi:hypothetical protein